MRGSGGRSNSRASGRKGHLVRPPVDERRIIGMRARTQCQKEYGYVCARAYRSEGVVGYVLQITGPQEGCQKRLV